MWHMCSRELHNRVCLFRTRVLEGLRVVVLPRSSRLLVATVSFRSHPQDRVSGWMSAPSCLSLKTPSKTVLWHLLALVNQLKNSGQAFWELDILWNLFLGQVHVLPTALTPHLLRIVGVLACLTTGQSIALVPTSQLPML